MSVLLPKCKIHIVNFFIQVQLQIIFLNEVLRKMSLAGWVKFLCVLPIFHPRWVASSIGDHCNNSRHIRGSSDYWHTVGASLDGHVVLFNGRFGPGPPFGGRLLYGKNRED